ncbi:MAG TPA: HAMP domain-containing sensor histidine kinase [Polyangiaceae bacterium]|nr:HAMP domain-containing sensor histidine kinase [Polyangiaceae bacterium]
MKALRSPNLAMRLTAVGIVQLAAVLVMALFIGFLVARQSRHTDMDALTRRIESKLTDPVALLHELEQIAKQDDVQLSVYDDEQHLLASNLTPALPLGPGHGLRDPFSLPALPAFGTSTASGHQPGLFTEPTVLPPPPDVALLGEPAPPPRGLPPGPLPPHLPGAAAGTELTALVFGPPKDPPPRVVIARLDGGGLVVARFLPQRHGLWTALLVLGSGLGVVAIGAILMARFITRPMARLSSAVRAFGEGDLSARAALTRNDEIGALGTRFDEMADRIQDLLRTEKELLANVAHELRTPLARIRVALDIAEESEANAARASLGEIGTDLKELEALVDDILTAARLSLSDETKTRSALALHKRQIASSELAARAAQRFSTLHPERPLALELAPNLPALDADPSLLRRVLDNLLDNAHKYTPDKDSPIALHASRETNCVRFDVVDSGMGIAEAERSRLFTPFFRTERSRSRATGGVGLGLTLAKRIVNAHAGSIDIESHEGLGTRVVVRLPLRVTVA